MHMRCIFVRIFNPGCLRNLSKALCNTHLLIRFSDSGFWGFGRKVIVDPCLTPPPLPSLLSNEDDNRGSYLRLNKAGGPLIQASGCWGFRYRSTLPLVSREWRNGVQV